MYVPCGFSYFTRDQYKEQEDRHEKYVVNYAVIAGPPLQPVNDPDFANGNWGTLKLRTTGQCLGVETVYLKVQTRICHESDEANKFRYVPSTGEIQNWKYPESSGGKGCVTRSGNQQFYVTRCTGSPEQKFIIKNGERSFIVAEVQFSVFVYTQFFFSATSIVETS